MTKPIVHSIEVVVSQFKLPDLGVDTAGYSLVYQPGGTKSVKAYGVRIVCDDGLVGEYVGGDAVGLAQMNKFADTLIGKSPLQRELIYNDLKRCLRKFDKMGMGMVDLPLWDLAGKYYGASVSELLGGWRKRLPAYASTMSGDRNGGLDSPEAFAEFAVQCKSLGYQGYKLHVWDDYSVRELTRTILAVRKAVGDDMHLMLDPACKLQTFTEALEVGRACDEANYLWYEDPYRDTGISSFSHRMLREKLKTPLCQTEHIRGVEEHVNFIVAGGTDIVRTDAEYDGGITGAMKIAHAAEGFGLDVEIHGPGPMHRHLMSALRNSNYYEMSLVHPKTPQIGRCQEIYACGYRDGLTAIDADGMVAVPEGPGFGVVYDWDFIRAHQVDGKIFN
ncbi:enolase C-terminal domain-like protein [Paraburkholderia agricolaris]|uniref:Enolase C-terminal domain-like protein n=1 Tax=Paraburkholderia agricolaris TaxID=2152888 RepID=A0ABW8ZZG2_9BURK|nr:enolase C-terminal domain-like protein [Paraburkholderia agricolaris]